MCEIVLHVPKARIYFKAATPSNIITENRCESERGCGACEQPVSVLSTYFAFF